jgi:hypothetical protein
MTKSEAGRRGAVAYKTAEAARKKVRVQEYDKNPKRCLECGSPIPYEKKTRGCFCSRSCAATHNNKGVRRIGAEPRDCPNCGERTKSSRHKFCSIKCQTTYQYKEYIRNWLAGQKNGTTCRGMGVSNHIRRWLIEEKGYQCSICQTKRWEGQPVPLVLDHIDGNGENSSPNNVRLVCGNCNMLLSTFAGRNRGRGRQARKIWDDKLMSVMRGSRKQ